MASEAPIASSRRKLVANRRARIQPPARQRSLSCSNKRFIATRYAPALRLSAGRRSGGRTLAAPPPINRLPPPCAIWHIQRPEGRGESFRRPSTERWSRQYRVDISPPSRGDWVSRPAGEGVSVRLRPIREGLCKSGLWETCGLRKIRPRLAGGKSIFYRNAGVLLSRRVSSELAS